MGQLDGRAGIITGAASGIGAATARALAREGAKLVLLDKLKARVPVTATDVEAIDPVVPPLPMIRVPAEIVVAAV